MQDDGTIMCCHNAAVLHVVYRASGQALAGTIALHAADGNNKCLLEARLWVTASRGTIDTIFDMLSQVRRVLKFITNSSDSQTLTDITTFVCSCFCLQLFQFVYGSSGQTAISTPDSSTC